MDQKIIALIPARGDLLGNQKRNLALIDGIPLIKFTIDYAKSCKDISKTIVLTNDSEIADFAVQCGAEVPFLMPDNLAGNIRIKDVLAYCIEELKKKEDYSPDLVVFLEPTHPFRENSWIEKMIQIMKDNNLDHAFTSKTEKDNFWRITETGEIAFLGSEKDVVRAKKDPIYREMGGLCSVMKTSVLISPERTGKNVGMIPIAGIFSTVDIKTEEDLFIAEQIYKKYIKKSHHE